MVTIHFSFCFNQATDLSLKEGVHVSIRHNLLVSKIWTTLSGGPNAGSIICPKSKEQNWERDIGEKCNYCSGCSNLAKKKTICFDCLHPLNLTVRKRFLHKSWIPGITAKSSSWNRKEGRENFLKSVFISGT